MSTLDGHKIIIDDMEL